jgi:hypothetical protein
MPKAAERLQHYKGERPIFDLYAIDEEIAKALGRRVDLKSGGYLIIDQTEALTTVDVNTGGYVGARNFEDTIFKTNLEAAQAIARQLRLRNLGGIVIADFIDMSRTEHQDAVLAEFRKQLARDRVKTMAGGFSSLGLLEMTRKRTRESLAHMLCEPCPSCQGKGIVKTPRSVVYDILREILREARQFNPREFRIVAASAVIDLLLDEESQHLAGLSDFIAKPISLQVETSSCSDHAAGGSGLGCGDSWPRFLDPVAAVVQPRISTATGQQLRGGALLDDAPPLHHDDPVCVLDGGQAVRHDQGGATQHEFLQGVLHQALRFVVQRRGCLVQNQNGRVFVQRAGNRQALTLSA